MSRKIEISRQTIVFTAFFIMAIWFAGRIMDIILIFFVSVIFMSAFKPVVEFMEKFHIPRGPAIVLLYLTLWSIIGAVVASLVPPLIEQTRGLVYQFPPALKNVQYLNDHQQEITNQLLSNLGTLPANFVKLITGLFGNLLNLVTTIVISFYLLVERNNLDKHLSGLLSPKLAKKVLQIVQSIEDKLGGWIRGEILLMTCVGLMTYVGLILLRVDTAIPLAILAGMLEIIPSVGPTVSAIPAVLLALTIHPLLALSTAALYFLIQFVENNFLVPQIMRKAAGVHPLVSILSLMVGFKLAGTVGAILAIPSVLIIRILAPHLIALIRSEPFEVDVD